MSPGRLRTATAADAAELLRLWSLLFGDDDGDGDGGDGDGGGGDGGGGGAPSGEPWREHAHAWFARYADDPLNARFPVVEVDGELVATAVGTLEIGVPNPQCARGRTVRLANVITLPGHRGHGYGTRLVLDVVEWARSIAADRVDLSATPDGQRVYEKLGFTLTSAPRMKLVL
jgi:GNAT superfamily N-acetyltransferase